MSMGRKNVGKRNPVWMMIVAFMPALLWTGSAASLAGCGSSEPPPALTAGERSSDDSEYDEYESRSASRKKEKKEEEPALAGPIPINDVTAEELARYDVPRLGPATARKIIEFRDEYGPFGSYDDLDKAPRVGPSLLEAFKKVGVDFGDAAATATPATAETEIEATEEVTEYEEATTSSASTPASSGGLINLNTATEKELTQIKGIGPSLAGKIIAYRNEHGGFSSVDELDNVSGIGPAKLESIRPHVTVK